MMGRLLMNIATAIVVPAARADDAAAHATLQRAFPRRLIQGISKTPVPGVLQRLQGEVPHAELEAQLQKAAKR
jgi:hypothetical protein